VLPVRFSPESETALGKEADKGFIGGVDGPSGTRIQLLFLVIFIFVFILLKSGQQ